MVCGWDAEIRFEDADATKMRATSRESDSASPPLGGSNCRATTVALNGREMATRAVPLRSDCQTRKFEAGPEPGAFNDCGRA